MCFCQKCTSACFGAKNSGYKFELAHKLTFKLYKQAPQVFVIMWSMIRLRGNKANGPKNEATRLFVHEKTRVDSKIELNWLVFRKLFGRAVPPNYIYFDYFKDISQLYFTKIKVERSAPNEATLSTTIHALCCSLSRASR